MLKFTTVSIYAYQPIGGSRWFDPSKTLYAWSSEI